MGIGTRIGTSNIQQISLLWFNFTLREYLEPLHGCSTTETIPDGLYPGVVKVIIDGTGTTVDEWSSSKRVSYNLKKFCFV